MNVLRTLVHFKWVTLVVVLLTCAGVGAMLYLTPRTFQVDASYVLVNPNLPTASQLQRDPGLSKGNNNPYLRFANQAMVGQVLATRVSSETVRRELVAQGADSHYTISPSDQYGGAGQIMVVVGTGTTPRDAQITAKLVIQRMHDDLLSMQEVYGASDRYLIRALPIAPPGQPQEQFSSRLRSVIAVGGAGLVALFAAISIAQAVELGWGRREGPAADASPASPTRHELATQELAPREPTSALTAQPPRARHLGTHL